MSLRRASTAIIFLSDHGDFAGSHGMHSKGGSVYDETLRVPLYVVTPNQSGSEDIFQMCSMVDIFRLVVELALGNMSNWATSAKYKDQPGNTNASLLSFIQSQSVSDHQKAYFSEHRARGGQVELAELEAKVVEVAVG